MKLEEEQELINLVALIKEREASAFEIYKNKLLYKGFQKPENTPINKKVPSHD